MSDIGKPKPTPWLAFGHIPLGRGIINMNITADGCTSNVPAEDPDTFSLAKLDRWMRDNPMPPEPLNGATELLYADNMRDAAIEAAAAVSRSRMGVFGAATVLVTRSELLPPGYILGRKGSEIVLMIGPPKEEELDGKVPGGKG